MHFAIDPEGRSPLYRQLADQIRYAVSVGELRGGDPLPSIRELETQLGINRNTVRQAYLQLEHEGLLELRQGREARVAGPRGPASRVDALERADLAEDIATQMLRRAEADGVDALQLAAYFAELAREHDAAHPKWAYVECCPVQAADGARQVEHLLGRHVAHVDLHDLRHCDGRRVGELPGSVRVVVTPHWHAAECEELLRDRAVHVRGIRVHLSEACEQALSALAGRPIALVVRDAESAPGFGKLVGRYVAGAAMRLLTADDAAGLARAAREAHAFVFTTPCRAAVGAAARPGQTIQELRFETSAADVQAVRDELLPPLARACPA